MTARKGNTSVDMSACFPETVHKTPGCIHLPVAHACNLQCRYCSRKFDEPAPGTNVGMLTPHEAVEHVRNVSGRSKLHSAFISGPGEPLANAATYVVLRQLKSEFPGLKLGLSTNGLLLRDRLEQIAASGLKKLALTINAVRPETVKKLYSRILYRGRRYGIEDAALFLIKNQWQGLSSAVDAGMDVNVSSVLVPGINDDELPLIAEESGKRGVKLMHIHPFVPRDELVNFVQPDAAALAAIQERCRPFIPEIEIN